MAVNGNDGKLVSRLIRVWKRDKLRRQDTKKRKTGNGKSDAERKRRRERSGKMSGLRKRREEKRKHWKLNQSARDSEAEGKGVCLLSPNHQSVISEYFHASVDYRKLHL